MLQGLHVVAQREGEAGAAGLPQGPEGVKNTRCFRLCVTVMRGLRQLDPVVLVQVNDLHADLRTSSCPSENDYCATPQHTTPKNGGSQLCSCEFDGHRSYSRLLLAELWYASPEFPDAETFATSDLYTFFVSVLP